MRKREREERRRKDSAEKGLQTCSLQTGEKCPQSAVLKKIDDRRCPVRSQHRTSQQKQEKKAYQPFYPIALSLTKWTGLFSVSFGEVVSSEGRSKEEQVRMRCE
jgi:hypothetical protein